MMSKTKKIIKSKSNLKPCFIYDDLLNLPLEESLRLISSYTVPQLCGMIGKYNGTYPLIIRSADYKEALINRIKEIHVSVAKKDYMKEIDDYGTIDGLPINRSFFNVSCGASVKPENIFEMGPKPDIKYLKLGPQTNESLQKYHDQFKPLPIPVKPLSESVELPSDSVELPSDSVELPSDSVELLPEHMQLLLPYSYSCHPFLPSNILGCDELDMFSEFGDENKMSVKLDVKPLIDENITFNVDELMII